MSESLIKLATSLHDRVAQAVAPLRGQVVREAQIKDAYEAAFPDAKRDFQWVRGADHASNRATTGSCECSKTENALFDRIGHGKYLVRPTTMSRQVPALLPEEIPESAPTADFSEYVLRAEQILARGQVHRPVGVVKPKVEYTDTAQFYRDPKVRAWVLQRADGRCELCKMPAPFLTDSEEAYLESHHLILLSEGGPDIPENTSALCPNCHRKMHYSKGRVELRDLLTQVIAAKEATYAQE